MTTDPLVHFLERRDQASFAALVAGTRDGVLRAAFRVLGDSDAAEDVTQDVFLKCLNPPWSADEVRSGPALLAATAVNLAKMRIRGEVRRRAREEVSAEVRAGADGGLGRDEIEHVRVAVGNLPESLRRPVELRYFGGLQLAELARALDVSLSTAKARLSEARTVLRTHLGDARYGVTLAFVAAESQVSGVPDPQPTAVFLAKLERLATEGVQLSRIAAEPARKWRSTPARRWAAPAVAGALLIALGGGLWVALYGDDDGRPAHVATLPTDDGGDDASGAPGERRRVTIDAAAAADSVTDGAQLGEQPSPDGAHPAASAEEVGTISLSVEVVDEAGNLIRDGHAHIDVAGFPGFDVMEKLARWKSLLDPQSLAGANPVVVEAVPDFADGVEIEATATVPGFAPARPRTATLRSGERATIRVVVVREREAVLTVVDSETGDPVPGAEVLFLTELDRRGLDEDAPPSSPSPGVGLTDASGRAVVGGLGEGPHEVEIRAPGYVARVIDELTIRGETVAKLARLRNAGTIVVEVLAPDGSAAVGQRVNLNITGRDTDLVGTIDVTGRCRFDDVPVGGQAVVLEIDDWMQHMLSGAATSEGTALSQTLEVVAGAEHLVRLGVLRAAAPMLVDVVGVDGKPRAGVQVEIYGPLLKDAKSDASGRVAFEGLPAGTYTVHVQNGEDEASEWTALRDVEIATGSPAHVRVVAGDRTVSGRVVLEGSGKPVHRTLVFVTDDSGRVLLLWTDRDGRFSFGGALAGGLKISVAAGGDLVTEQLRVAVPADSDPAPLSVTLRIGGSLLIHPPAGDAATYRLFVVPDQARKTKPTDDGDHLLRGLPAGSFTLEVVRDDVASDSHPVTIRVGEQTVLDLR